MQKKEFENRINSLKIGNHVKIVWRGNYGINEDYGQLVGVDNGRILLATGFNISSQRVIRIDLERAQRKAKA